MRLPMRLLVLINVALAEDPVLQPIDVDADNYVGVAVQDVLKKQAPLLDVWAREQAAENLERHPKIPPFDQMKPLVSKAIDKLKPAVRDMVKSLPALSQKAVFEQESPRLGKRVRSEVPHRLPLPPASKHPAQSGSKAVTNFNNVLAAVPHRLPLPPTASNRVRKSGSGFQAFEDFTFSVPNFNDDVPELDDGADAPHKLPIPPTPSKHVRTEKAHRVTILTHSAPQRPAGEAGSPRQVTQEEEAEFTPPRQVTQDEEAELTAPRQVTQEEEAELTAPRQVTLQPTEKTLPREVHKRTAAPWGVPQPKAQPAGTDNGSSVFSLSCTLAMLTVLLV
ncbi:MAG: uncharacterized protein KVP18_000160 [Porospora cf. gigantea A]|uniref:uncharacterized protein n=2 Tax=Porospora cf. gigantea A TaxID=2853593 RepID=UPI00355A5B4A|nr:MAG: hypothetical protein KVP18_000160 [Porospora cf. gigantea A]